MLCLLFWSFVGGSQIVKVMIIKIMMILKIINTSSSNSASKKMVIIRIILMVLVIGTKKNLMIMVIVTKMVLAILWIFFIDINTNVSDDKGNYTNNDCEIKIINLIIPKLILHPVIILWCLVIRIWCECILETVHKDNLLWNSVRSEYPCISPQRCTWSIA